MSLQIGDEDGLYRRIHRDFVKNDGSGGFRPTSQAFTDESLSVDWDRHCTLDDCVRRSPENIGWIAALQAGAVRNLEPRQDVRHDPVPDNFAHALVQGPKPKSLCRRLAEMASLKVKVG